MDPVIDDNFNSLIDAFENRPFGQRRTGWNREFVVLGKMLVFKGPFDVDKRTIIDIRSKLMFKWRTPLVVLVNNFIKVDVGLFAVYSNVDDTNDEVKLISHTERMKFRGLHRTYQVVQREKLQKLNTVLDTDKDVDWIFDQFGLDIVVALVHLWILKVGDTGVFNMVVRLDHRKVYIIDYDELLEYDREDELFYFDKRPAVRFNWYGRIRKHYNEAAQQIKSLLNENVNSTIAPRIERAAALLIKYAE